MTQNPHPTQHLIRTARDNALPRTGTPARPGTRATGPVLMAATVGMGLMAGLFFAFDVAVMPGLAQSDDLTFVSAMQSINRAIQNGLFGLVFVGAFIATGLAAVLQHRAGARPGAVRWTWAALLLYTLALAITMAVNIPLNNTLDSAGTPSRIPDPGAVRDAFEGPWRTANAFRTLACTAALGCLGRALTLRGRARSGGQG